MINYGERCMIDFTNRRPILKKRKVVLVDGTTLAKLMIEYNLGVSTEATYEIKRIDSDFFAEDLD